MKKILFHFTLVFLAAAGFSCAGKLSSLLMMPVFGFVQSTVFFIAQNTAALQPGRVKEGLREGRRNIRCCSSCHPRV